MGNQTRWQRCSLTRGYDLYEMIVVVEAPARVRVQLTVSERELGTFFCFFSGFGDRLLNEVKKLSVKDVKIKIYAPPERKYSTWIGGSILAGLSTFKKVILIRTLCICRKTSWPNLNYYFIKPDVGIRGRISRRPRNYSQESWILTL